MRLYLIRHADPDYANGTITAAGHQEAKALARRLAGLGLTHIYCSPLGRAQHTARYTLDQVPLEAQTCDWLQELRGCYIPIPDHYYHKPQTVAWDVPGEIIRSVEPLPTQATWTQAPMMDDPAFAETFEMVRRESDGLLARHGYVREGGRYRIERSSRDQVAVFCHGGLILTWLAHLLELPLVMVWAGFWPAPSSVTTVLIEERSTEWAVPRCIGFGDVSHLYAAGLPVQPAGLKGNVL